MLNLQSLSILGYDTLKDLAGRSNLMLLTLKLAEAAKPLILFPLLLQIQQLPLTHPVAMCKQNNQKQPILQPKAQPTLQSTASFPCTAPAQPSPGLRAALNFFSLLQKAPGATAARESLRVPGVSHLPPQHDLSFKRSRRYLTSL